MKYLIFLCAVIASSAATAASEGPLKSSYRVAGSMKLIACDSDSNPATPIGDWYFGPVNVRGKCVMNPDEECNVPFGFVLFDQGKPYSRFLNDQESELCGVAGSWKSCAYVSVSLKTLPDNSDVVHVKTAHTSNTSQRIESENDYPIERFVSRERSFSGTADGCKRYELTIKVHPLN